MEIQFRNPFRSPIKFGTQTETTVPLSPQEQIRSIDQLLIQTQTAENQFRSSRNQAANLERTELRRAVDASIAGKRIETDLATTKVAYARRQQELLGNFEKQNAHLNTVLNLTKAVFSGTTTMIPIAEKIKELEILPDFTTAVAEIQQSTANIVSVVNSVEGALTGSGLIEEETLQSVRAEIAAQAEAEGGALSRVPDDVQSPSDIPSRIASEGREAS